MAPAKVTSVATFPVNYFIENIAVRSDDSILVTVLNHKTLYYLPPPGTGSGDPVLLHEFNESAMGIVEGEPDVFYISSSNGWSDHRSALHRLDMRSFSASTLPKPVQILTFPERARGLNGSCALSPTVLLLADCFADLVWRIDLRDDGEVASCRVWLAHASMACNRAEMPDTPGINGIKYCAKNSHVYYTTTAQLSFSRVRVDPETLEPAGDPEYIAGGMRGDDFIIDDAEEVAYVTTHRENTIAQVALEPGKEKVVVLGEPLHEDMVGPTAAAWSRRDGAAGKVMYVTTDGGIMRPLPGGVRPAMVLRVEV